ncbi:pimeloyl-ACP methyl ester carboxylesterase [Herbihabitans rhizosphaerae]|uniref:Pimeloyl-ACP methyl ester carboxylesterase n=1 Tax=Herbihabitans rhizosphaerae TaxID=1872711 RepID=A0A4Q7L5Q8_9PSEU|nr:alpha/beta hydrolase [Herbihabitans rhizosphaerae]RZS43602.1 pimeloyl-ACP methyl ester carboxylesterase [Herbihabitans rhizosphaerae]
MLTEPGELVLPDGTRLHVVRTGEPGAAITVVLAHSYAQDHRIWHKVLDVLPHATERPVGVLAYDHRGHGDSEPATPATATVEQLGADLAGVITEGVPTGRVILVGHGMGGLAVMALIEAHRELFTERVAGVVFVNTAAGWLADTSTALPSSVGRLVQDLERIIGAPIIGRPSIGPIRQRIDRATAIGLRWLLLGDDPDPEDVQLVADMVLRHWPDTVAMFRPGLADARRASALEVASDTPVVAIVGEKDRLVPETDAAVLADAVRDGTAIVLPRLGHMLPLEGAPEIIPRIVALVHAAYRSSPD